MSYAKQYFDQVGGPIYTLPELNVTPDWGHDKVYERGQSLEDIIGRDLRPSPTDEEVAKKPVTFTANGLSLTTIVLIAVGALVILKISD